MATNSLVVVSDPHCGCRMGLCPPEGVQLDDGGMYMPSEFQLKMWSMWLEFWEWVEEVRHGEPYDLDLNGDAEDGVHHGSTTQISHNLGDQSKIAIAVLRPRVERCQSLGGLYYHQRGTEAHSGKSGVEEERLAEMLGAVPNKEGQYARQELWKRVGSRLVHIMHHIGCTGSAAYETTAVHKEMVDSICVAGRWNEEPPDVVVRSHRHIFCRTEAAGAKGTHISIVTPGWQGKTPFSNRIAGARISPPQFGGIFIREGEGTFYIRHKIFYMPRPEVE